ncbi:MAG: hypothetical protein M1536_01245 [Firmicutes bacterium]|nr:hypothetical protein [Bacillota bacterium]
MKHLKFLLVITAAAFIILQCQPARADQISRYPVYDTKVQRLIIDELKAAEESQETISKWLKGEIPQDEAVGELKAYRDRVRQINNSIQEIKVSAEIDSLHKTVIKFSSRFKKFLEDSVKIVQETDTSSKSDMKNLLTFTDAFSDSFLNLQVELNSAVYDFQKKYNFSKETQIIRSYYKWSTAILPYDIKFFSMQKTFSELFTRAVVEHANFDEILKDVKKLSGGMSAMMISINKYKPPFELQELHSMWLEGYKDFGAAIKLFETFLNSPAMENLNKMYDLAQVMTEKSIKLTESMIKFQERNFKI